MLLALRFAPIWASGAARNALFHSVSAFCNAGIDLMGKYGDFLTAYASDPLVMFTIASLTVIGNWVLVWSDLIFCRGGLAPKASLENCAPQRHS